MTDTARFWVFINSEPVLVKMRKGQTLSHVSGGPTDEGFSFEGRQWEFDGEKVIASTTIKAQDCDGRLDQYFESKCYVANLKAGYAMDNITYPAWEKVETSQRDYSAEAMGY